MDKKESLALTLLFLLLPLLYFFKLDTLPLAIHGDEAWTAIQALEILKNPTHLIGVGWYDLPLISFTPHALGMFIFERNIVGDRLGSVFFGLGTLPFFYLLLRKLLNNKIAILSTLLLATSHIWIALSRIGITYVQASFFLISAFYFFFSGTKTNRKIYFVLSGLMVGIGMYSYSAIRALPLIFIPLIIFYILHKNKLGTRLLNLCLMLLIAFVVFSPQIGFFIKNPGTFFSRSNSVFVLSRSGKQWENNFDTKSLLINQVEKTFSIWKGDNSGQYGYKGPLFDYLTLLLFTLGIIESFRLKLNLKIFLYTWLGTSLLGQILTTVPGPIFLPRFVVGIPVFYIFVGLGFYLIKMSMNYFKVNRKLQKLVLLFSLIYIIIFNLNIYFFLYLEQLSGDPNAYAATKIGKYLNNNADNYQTIFLTSPNLHADFSTIKFLAPKSNTIDVNQPGTYKAAHVNKTIFVIYPNYKYEIEEIIKTNPTGQLLVEKNNFGDIQYYIYKVE